MSTDTRVEVADAAEFQEGDHRLVDVNGVEVGVIKVDSEYYALRNECPHDGGPVCTGAVHNELVGAFSEPGSRVEQSYGDELVIACPWHGWPFYLETGEHIGEPSIRVPVYAVTIEDGTVYIETET